MGAVEGLDGWLAATSSRDTLITVGREVQQAVLERLVVDGDAYVVKHIRAEDDWIMRVTGDEGRWFLLPCGPPARSTAFPR